jgi:hypothetical protein
MYAAFFSPPKRPKMNWKRASLGTTERSTKKDTTTKKDTISYGHTSLE